MSLGFSLGVAMLAPPVFADTVTPCDSVACIKIQKDPWLATGLNVIPFGVGSYNQGDHVGGSVIAAMDTLSLLAVAAPFTFLPDLTRNGGWGAAAFVAYGLGGFLLGRAVGFTLPWFHYASYENALDEKSARINSTSADTGPVLANYQWAF